MQASLTRPQADEIVRTTSGWGGPVVVIRTQECYGIEFGSEDSAAVKRMAQRKGFLASVNDSTATMFHFADLTGWNASFI